MVQSPPIQAQRTDLTGRGKHVYLTSMILFPLEIQGSLKLPRPEKSSHDH